MHGGVAAAAGRRGLQIADAAAAAAAAVIGSGMIVNGSALLVELPTTWRAALTGMSSSDGSSSSSSSSSSNGRGRANGSKLQPHNDEVIT